MQKATLTIGRNRRQFIELDKENALIPVNYDTTPRQRIGYNEALRRTFRDERVAFTEEQVRALAAANAENEKAWPLPLESWHAGQLTSAFAELGNVASAEGTAGATTAAAFLSRFVRDEGKGWVHLDLAASYQKSGNELWATGAKGHGLRTIARWLQEVAE